MRPTLLFMLWMALSSLALATGPYPGGPEAPDTDAIPANSPLFQRWAHFSHGHWFGPRQAGLAGPAVNYGSGILGPPNAAGANYPPVSNEPVLDAPVLSLGDGGWVNYRVNPPIRDAAGPDFAVFENGFAPVPGMLFAELAFVEVSSNGRDFVRFPAVSCTQTGTQVGTFGTLDPRNLHNLAGKHPAGYGTPFDLTELAGSPNLDIHSIVLVRVRDVVGDVKNAHGSRDSLGNWINDPWPTNFQTCGFDLDAIGVIHPETDPWLIWVDLNFPAGSQNVPGIIAPAADPDDDGRSNLVEWATGTFPDRSNGGGHPPVVEILAQEATVSLQFQRVLHPDMTLTLEQSSDGIHWTALAVSTAGGPLLPSAGVTVEENILVDATDTVTLPREAAAGMFRLRIVRTP